MAELSAVDRALSAARARIEPRVRPDQLVEARSRGALVVDIRPSELRRRDGELDRALVVDRNVLEWRLDPTSVHKLAEVKGPTQRVIVVCDEGYASSLAAAALADLGLVNATDLDGGYQAWAAYQRSHSEASSS